MAARELYHCLYQEPRGDALLTTYFGKFNGREGQFLFAATHLSKALAFAFSYHDREVLLNGAIDGTENEMVVLAGGQAALDKKRHIRVFAFSGDGFTDLEEGSRQAVSEVPVPFSSTRLVLETRDINDLMKNGLQIFVLPEPQEFYAASHEVGQGKVIQCFENSAGDGEALAKLMKHMGARWINRERNTGVCAKLHQDIINSRILDSRSLRGMKPETP